MAESRRYGVNQQLGCVDIEQILLEAQHRWLRPAEICEILRNYRKFHIAPEPPNRPPSGSLFLFDRKVLRYFRKDGHNWRKKKDGKTVKEAHERLKAESVDVLHCYYAHGEDNENFQRRTYWMLEESFMHIVLVHYLEVKGSKASFSRTRDDEISRGVQMDSPVCSNSFTSQNQLPSQTTEAGSPNSTQTSEYEADSDNYQARSRYHSFLGLQQYENGPIMDIHLSNSNVPVPSQINQYDHQKLQAVTPEIDILPSSQEDMTKVFNETGLGLGFSGSRAQFGLPLWDKVSEHNASEFPSSSFNASLETEDPLMGNVPKQSTLAFGELFKDELIVSQDVYKAELQVSNSGIGSLVPSKIHVENDFSLGGNVDYPSILKQPSLELCNIEGEGLQKYDSFSKWMSKELGEVDDSHMKSTSQAYWNFIENSSVEDPGISNPEHLDAYMMSPSVSQDQLFSIVDFSPNWAYSGLETKVLVTGRFLKDKKDLENIKLSCMFGEVEVPAEILADGILRCHAPLHKSGIVPFYITCSNRLACSEVREFEYKVNPCQRMETSDSSTCDTDEIHLHVRLGKLLSLGSVDNSSFVSSITEEKLNISNKISLLLKEGDDRWFSILESTSENEFSPDSIKDQLLQKLLKERLHDWLLHKVAEEGKGPSVLDEEGQGVIHLTAALGYDWAIKPIVTAGVNINFRDAHGWTALHWSAFCGRERTVVSLVTLGAAAGALTDPTPEFPSGRTPADLASGNGHKGIAGFLAESSLTSHLSTLNIKDARGMDMADVSGVEGLENLEEQSAIQLADGDTEAGLSLKDSLCAVRNAALAAARIHQVFRVHSFQRKRLAEYGDDQCGISDEHALSLISVKTSKSGQHDMPVHAAAVRIQNKYRGWKGRKEFLITRQRIVKIQAHVRGHQVRKRYKKIVWTVGIVEKIILRWRRKRSGLRGFRSEGLIEGTSMQTEPTKEDDYDFLQEGRKQTEVRLDKALARVKSMVQYPEARDQYRRLLNVVTELQETNAAEETILHETEAVEGDFMNELEEFWENDAAMPTG